MSDGKQGAVKALERLEDLATTSTESLGPKYVAQYASTLRAHIAAQDAELARLRREAARDEERAHEMQGMLADARAEVERLREAEAVAYRREVAERLLPALEIVEAMRPDVRASAYDALRLNRLLLELREMLLPSDGGEG